MNEPSTGLPRKEPRGDEPTAQFGRFRVVRTLAFGGMAQILLATEGPDGPLVVLKRILPHYAQQHEFVQFFIHEGRLGQRLVHPNLVQTLEAGQVDGVPYIALEYLRGKPAIEVLRHAARQQVEVPLGVAVRIVADAARGLHHAHTASDADGRPLNVVHRDVTPHNLYVCADGMTKVLDFGIAKAASQLHHTRTGTIKGKFAYLAPEQIKGEGIDHRVDVFALGIVLHELLTLKPLFRGTNDGDTLQRILTFEVPAPERIRRKVPPGLGAVALRALQRDRDRRLPSAEALADSIEAVAVAEGIDASPAAVRALLQQLFPHPEDLGEPAGRRTSSASVTGQGQVSDALPETPPHGLTAIDDEAVPASDEGVPADVVVELPTHRVPLRGAARDVSGTHTRERRRARAGRAALLVAGASALLAMALGSSTCLHRIGSRPIPAASGGRPVEAHDEGALRPTPRESAPHDTNVSQPPALQNVGGGPLQPIDTPQGAPVPLVAPVVDAPKEATLRVQTDGGASFLVDGKPTRPAPDGALHLRPGRHSVTVSATGLASPRTLSVELAPGEAALRAVHGGKGWLRVAVTPWAEVVVDGRTLGVTPLQPAELSEGAHVVTLKNGDLGMTTRRRILITPNKEALLKVDLFAR
jgi:serine/threonine-protein kinase